MYIRGRCSDAHSATAETVADIRASISKTAKFSRSGKRQGPAFTRDISQEASMNSRASELSCRDDSALWWDACSKLSCMNNMVGVDPRCKYRIADASANPLGGSKDGMYQFGLDQLAHHGNTAISHLLTMNYYHDHCGSGFDRRMMWSACHFPAKRWCPTTGLSHHVRNNCAHTYRCNSTLPCLWQCGPAGASVANLPELYSPRPHILDEVLPTVCTQPTIDERLGANAVYAHMRKSICRATKSDAALEARADLSLPIP